MKRFNFPLEKVCQWRRDQAELEELKLQKLYGDLRAIDDARSQVESEQANAARQVRLETQDLVNLDSFRQYTRGCLTQIANKRKDCEARIHQQQQAVIEARRRFELLARLKEKALIEWSRQRDKEQEELAAELYLAKRRRDHE